MLSWPYIPFAKARCPSATILKKFSGAVMKKEDIGFFGGWALFLLLFVATLIIIRWSVDFVTWSSLDSGWAQAIGSVAAIFAGFTLARWQLKQNRHDERRRLNADDDRRLKTVLAIFRQIDEMAAEVGDAIDGGNKVALGSTPWLHITDRSTHVRSLPLFEIPSTDVVEAILGAPRALDDLSEKLFLLYPEPGRPTHSPEETDIANAVAVAREKCRVVIATCGAAIGRLSR
jgi:hypothetical protein